MTIDVACQHASRRLRQRPAPGPSLQRGGRQRKSAASVCRDTARTVLHRRAMAAGDGGPRFRTALCPRRCAAVRRASTAAAGFQTTNFSVASAVHRQRQRGDSGGGFGGVLVAGAEHQTCAVRSRASACEGGNITGSIASAGGVADASPTQCAPIGWPIKRRWYQDTGWDSFQDRRSTNRHCTPRQGVFLNYNYFQAAYHT